LRLRYARPHVLFRLPAFLFLRSCREVMFSEILAFFSG